VKAHIFIVGLIILSLTGGCGQITGKLAIKSKDSTSTVTTTFDEKPVKTLRSTITPFPVFTRRPTSTNFSGVISGPTIPPLPSFSPNPLIIPSKTISFTLRPQGTEITLTPNPLKCEVVILYPEWGQVFAPRTDFVAKWQVYNTGTVKWGLNDILFVFVSGAKLHHPDDEQFLLSMTVYVGDKINLQRHMVPPKEPGTYTTTWGLRRTNRKEPFCTFPIKIRVEK
jgi:hypothetical protein